MMKTAFAAHPSAVPAPDELGTLRAALEARLAALEAGLANPDQCESLEALVLDLARVATEEAEVAARRAIRQAQLDANKQLTAALAEAQAAEASLDAERAASLALQRDLGELRSELQSEHQTAAALGRDVEHARVTLETERATTTALRAEVHNAGQRLAASEAARQVDADALAARQRDLAVAQDDAAVALATHQRELQTAQGDAAAVVAKLQQELQAASNDAAAAQTASQQELQAARNDAAAAQTTYQRELQAAQGDTAAHVATLQRDLQAARDGAAAAQATHQRELESAQGDVAEVVATLQRELQAAQGDAAAQAEDLEAARARASALEQSHADLKDALNEAQASAEAAHRDRDDLAHALEDARRGSSAAGTEAGSRLESNDADRANVERARREAEARAEAAIRDRDAALAELATARQAANAVQENERGRFEELREKTERRILDLEVALLRGNAGSHEHDVEIPVPLEDPVVVVQDAPVRKASPLPFQSPRGASHPAPSKGANPPQPTRGASRQAFREALGVQIDGEAALLVDLSLSGAQVLSQTALKPARAVRMLLPSIDSPVLCRGKIAWARLEPASKGKSFRYRAGLYFTATDEAAVQAFMTRHAGGSPEGG